LPLEVPLPSHQPTVVSPDFPDALEIAEQIRKRRISPVEVVAEALARIEKLNRSLNAFIAVFGDQAMATARNAERVVMQRKRTLPPLFGVPISVKDIVLTTEAPTTAGSKIFGSGLVARQDAPVVRRLRRAGAYNIRNTKLQQLAIGVTSPNEHIGPDRNPHHPSPLPGASSGGSAEAEATGKGEL
jgi:aspartyl-tRNA(Asn)/glutamyl-tRNA(Gln) amidotransferase subunit A